MEAEHLLSNSRERLSENEVKVKSAQKAEENDTAQKTVGKDLHLAVAIP